MIEQTAKRLGEDIASFDVCSDCSGVMGLERGKYMPEGPRLSRKISSGFGVQS
jgi:hypothetical protein